jgi:hypothetical protein
MGPVAAKSYPGRQLLRVVDGTGAKRLPAPRAKQEADYGRRGHGYFFGAFQPSTGEALTVPDAGRTTANWVDFLEQVEAWIPKELERVYALMDNLQSHRSTDVLLFSLAHPRWEFVFLPKFAPYLNLHASTESS